jgi:hypothetical protein
MTTKYFRCPHCTTDNKVDKLDFDEAIKKNLLPTGVMAGATLVAGALTGGIGAVVLGSIFAANGAVNYFSVECGKCGRRFSIKRWEG